MNRKLLIIALLFTQINFHCKKEADVLPKIDVSKITETDEHSVRLGQVDNDDWKQASLTPAELALFQTPSPSQLANTEKANITIHPAYPNPTSGILYYTSNISKFTLLQIVITDNMLNVKDRFFLTPLGTNDTDIELVQLRFDSIKYSNNTNYRIYYGYYSLSDGLYFTGYGDIKVNK
jgi:hypothetical protein